MGEFTDRLKRTGKRAHERECSVFPAEKPCHDCAFRKGSPERADPERWAQIMGAVKNFKPFHCHFKHDGTEMPVGPDGEYQPIIRDGRPVGYPLCAGWVAMFDKEAREFNRREAASET